MTLVDIQGWLAGSRDYDAGLKILRQFLKDDFIVDVLELGDNPENRQDMIVEMRKLETQMKAEPLKSTARKEIVSDEEFNALPANVQQLVAQAKQMMKENGQRHGKLVQIYIDARARFKNKKSTERIECINQFMRSHGSGILNNTIQDTANDIASLLERIDYFREYKKFPEEIAKSNAGSESSIELKQQLLNARTKVSRYNKNPRKKDLLNEWTVKRDELQRRLDELV
jgi:hypothetical protein